MLVIDLPLHVLVWVSIPYLFLLYNIIIFIYICIYISVSTACFAPWRNWNACGRLRGEWVLSSFHLCGCFPLILIAMPSETRIVAYVDYKVSATLLCLLQVPGGPAQKHLEPGDVLIRLNGEVLIVNGYIILHLSTCSLDWFDHEWEVDWIYAKVVYGMLVVGSLWIMWCICHIMHFD